MSGQSRIEVGKITQSAMKGKVLESALANSLNSQEAPKGEKKK